MTELWMLCEHGEKGKHQTEWSYDGGTPCPGGHVATVEEVVEWLSEQSAAPASEVLFRVVKADDEEQHYEVCSWGEMQVDSWWSAIRVKAEDV